MAFTLLQALAPRGPPVIPPENMALGTLSDDLEAASLRTCEPGYKWNEQTAACVHQISQRSTGDCKYGFKKYERMDECRRIRYDVKPQKGAIATWFNDAPDSNPKKTEETLDSQLATHRPYRKLAQVPEEWYGYGYGFGRHYPHN